MHGIAGDLGDTIHRLDLWAGDAARGQGLAVVGEASGIGIPGRGGDQALAPEQLEHRAVAQAQDLVASAVGFEDMSALAQGKVAGVVKCVHLASRAMGSGQPPILPAARGARHRVCYNPDSF
ncbi:hypothetical protein WR25_24655 [Diploscapter pachys]|uniref:Uncharacterized protein n=1 Tax=Diploscapter pachys TaxID=2018661 RepID=A0A2A2K4V5_9BILA|nr:hypothetical protein WR25_24655 [Diploscapter pachys]